MPSLAGRKDRSPPTRPDVLVPKEVAAEWGCSEQHVRNMVNRGELGHFRLGGKLLRIPRSAMDEVERATKAPRRDRGK
ncbi:helix-turn-helix domain-containing protein [Methylobacterium sp. J-076]|uniref:helix-turn-helix domain-containing protein n=1 Tax=Methylobacterium sp. J-076 TaxID=2836655 RepID=UPI00391A5969